jgi:hypothetical protein
MPVSPNAMNNINKGVSAGTDGSPEAVSGNQPKTFMEPIAELAELGLHRNASAESAAASRLLGQWIYDLAPEQCPKATPLQLVIEPATIRVFGKVSPSGKPVRFYFLQAKTPAEIQRAQGDFQLKGNLFRTDWFPSKHTVHCDTCVAPEQLVSAISTAIPVLKETLARNRSVTNLTR